MKKIHIEIACAFIEPQYLTVFALDAGAKLHQALAVSGIWERTDACIARPLLRFGIYGKVVDAETYVLEDGDRIEVYRPLVVDPKQARRLRV